MSSSLWVAWTLATFVNRQNQKQRKKKMKVKKTENELKQVSIKQKLKTGVVDEVPLLTCKN